MRTSEWRPVPLWATVAQSKAEAYRRMVGDDPSGWWASVEGEIAREDKLDGPGPYLKQAGGYVRINGTRLVAAEVVAAAFGITVGHREVWPQARAVIATAPSGLSVRFSSLKAAARTMGVAASTVRQAARTGGRVREHTIQYERTQSGVGVGDQPGAGNLRAS